MTATRKVRVSARMADYLDSTQAGADLAAGRPVDDTVVLVFAALRDARPRKDGSRLIALDQDGLEALHWYADALAEGAADDAGRETDALADLNTARATKRAVEALLQRVAP